MHPCSSMCHPSRESGILGCYLGGQLWGSVLGIWRSSILDLEQYTPSSTSLKLGTKRGNFLGITHMLLCLVGFFQCNKSE